MKKHTCYYSIPRIKLLGVEVVNDEVHFSSDDIANKIDEMFKDNEKEIKNMIDIVTEIDLFLSDIVNKYEHKPSSEQVVAALESDVILFMQTLKNKYNFIEIE